MQGEVAPLDDPDRTVEYADEDCPAEYFCYRSFPVWHDDKSSAYANDFAGCAELDEDYLAHAVWGAEYILNCSSRESCGELPWNEKVADFCIPYGARSSGCFWYDVIDDRCFSVTSDELLTPEEFV